MKFIIEDKEDSPICQLLKSSENGENILCAGGNARVYSVLDQYYDEEFIIFFDLVPGNDEIRNDYDALLMKLDEVGYDNVSVVPIPCMEFIVLKMLHRYVYIFGKEAERVNNVVNNLVLDNVINVVKQDGTYEKVCKMLLGELKSRCMHNQNVANDSIPGLFYRSGCYCEEKYCRIKCKDTLSIKVMGEEHYKMLKMYGISTIKRDISDVQSMFIDWLNLLCDKLHVDRMNIMVY